MNMLKHLLTGLLVVLLMPAAYSQDSITVNDAVEMRVKAASLVRREFKELIDNISTTESSQDTKELISRSYSGNSNRIFLNSEILVEDDINPNHKMGATTEPPVSKYLGDFDLYYKKTEVPTIFFNDIHTSNVKKVTDIYVKVYFTSLFKSNHRYNDTAYTVNNRVAEIRFVRDDKRWTPYIVHIAFFNPSEI